MKKSILSLVVLSQPSKADPCLGNQLKPSKFALLNRVYRALCLAARIAESREFPGVTINRGDLQPCNAPPPTPTDAAGRRVTTSTPSRARAEVKGAPHPQSATAWLDFIHSPAAIEIFERYGFKPYTVG
jgi:hypothetical protein